MKITDIPSQTLHEYTAQNQMRLLYAAVPENPLVCLQLYIRTGSVHESSAQRGYAHFLEHLVFKNTARYPNNSLSLAASECGAVLNAYTDYDTTCYYLTLPSEMLDTGLEILSQMAVYSEFTTHDVEVEKSIIIEEIHQYEAEPEMDFIEYIQTKYFADSPLRYPVLGDSGSIRMATRESLVDFYRQHYVPQNAFLVATGDFDEKTLESKFLQYFAEWKPRNLAKKTALTTPIHEFRIFKRRKSSRDLIAIALPELNESHPDSEALHIAIRHLAIGKSSLLHKFLVEQERLCSSVKVSSLSGLMPGISVVLLAPTRRENLPKIVDFVFRAWKDIMQNGVPSEAFELVQKDIIHNWLYSFDGVENLANLIAAEEFNEDLSRIHNFGAYIESITNTALLQAVRTHWKWHDLALFLQTKLSYDESELSGLISQMQSATFPLPSIKISAPSWNKNRESLASSPTMHRQQEEYHEFLLPGGMKVVYNYQPGRTICGFALSSSLSQLNESKRGVNYFCSALMLYGTQKRNHEEIMRFSREHGFNIRVLHHLDSTVFRGRCHKNDLKHVLELLSEIIYLPSFDAKYLRMLQSAASDSLRRERDYPISVAYKSWFRQLFGSSNNLFSSTGNIAEIASINVEDCQTWHRHWNLGKGSALGVVGSLPPNEVKDLIYKYFSSTIGSSSPLQKLEYTPGKAHIIKRQRGLDQAIIHVGGFACPAKEQTDNSAFHILAHILGGDLSSRLFNSLREDLGFAYQTGFDFSSIRDLGFWYAYALCDATMHKQCLNALQDILDEVIATGITERELVSAKNYLSAISRMDNESVSYKATGIANLVSLGYDLSYYLDREKRIRATDLGTLHNLAKRYLTPENRQINILV